jgi:hypothetical protein
MSQQGNSLMELLCDMQQHTDNMSTMAQELCRALGIDDTSLSDSLQDEESSIAVSDSSSYTPSEIEISENSSHDNDSGAPHSV